MQHEFATALLDPERACPADVRTWNDCPPGARFAIHRNNVVSSLIDALADSFPVTQQLVGNEFFRAMTSIFVRARPPCSRVLTFYGDALPDFIDAFAPAGSVPYLADVARLEHARITSYHAADADPLSPDEARRAVGSGEHADLLRPVCHPSLIAFESSRAAVSIWAAHQGGSALESVDSDRAEACLVVRDGLDVVVLPVSIGVTTFVRSIAGGTLLGDAVSKALEADACFDVTAAMTLLMRHGALISMQADDAASS